MVRNPNNAGPCWTVYFLSDNTLVSVRVATLRHPLPIIQDMTRTAGRTKATDVASFDTAANHRESSPGDLLIDFPKLIEVTQCIHDLLKSDRNLP